MSGENFLSYLGQQNLAVRITNAKYLNEAAIRLDHITPAVVSHYCQKIIMRESHSEEEKNVRRFDF